MEVKRKNMLMDVMLDLKGDYIGDYLVLKFYFFLGERLDYRPGETA